MTVEGWQRNNSRFLALTMLSCVFAVGMGCARFQDSGKAGGLRWYKGNTHTHTLWSDGDAAPELSVKWYKDHGYDFLALSDHNLLQDHEKWFTVREDTRLTPERLAQLEDVFGRRWVETRSDHGRLQMRLKTLPELKREFESRHFLLIAAEEISAPADATHINGVNLVESVQGPAMEASSQVEAISAVLNAIEEQSHRFGVPMLGHINHPNWSNGITAEVFIEVGGERFFEVYNGHGAVRNWGSERLHIQSTERLWDIILSMRFKQGDTDRPMFGVGTDDTHNYFEQRIGLSNAGRGWIMVRAEALTPEALITAMKRGDFYASSGVTLTELSATSGGYTVAIQEEPGVTYRTEFVGTLKGFDDSSRPVVDENGEPVPNKTRIYSDEIGVVLGETTQNPAVYRFTGNELYVRARVVSSKLQENPHAEGDVEMAWAQPVLVK